MPADLRPSRRPGRAAGRTRRTARRGAARARRPPDLVRRRPCTGVTHDSRRVRPGDLYAAAARRPSPRGRFLPGRGPGRRRGRAHRSGRPGRRPAVRAAGVRGRRPPGPAGRGGGLGVPASVGAPAAHRGDRHQRQDHHDLPAGDRAAPGRSPDRAGGRGGDQGGGSDHREPPHHAGGDRPAGAVRRHGQPRRHRRGDGGVQSRAGARPGGRDRLRASRSSPTCPRTTWTSTAASTSTSRRRPACSRPAYTRVGRGEHRRRVRPPAGRRAHRSRSPPSPPTGDPAADWRAVDVRAGADGSTFRVVGPGGVEADASVALPGPFNVANALGADRRPGGGGRSAWPTAVAGVAACPGVPGRLERVEAGQDFTVLVDYSHKPGAVEAVLRRAAPGHRGRLCIVLGCGGDRDRAKRPLMGAAAARLADVAILTSDNPRSEDPLAILAEMLAGVLTVPEQDAGPGDHRAGPGRGDRPGCRDGGQGGRGADGGQGPRARTVRPRLRSSRSTTVRWPPRRSWHSVGRAPPGEVRAGRQSRCRGRAAVIPLSLAADRRDHRRPAAPGDRSRGTGHRTRSSSTHAPPGPGALFAALPGQRADGHRLRRRGAVAAGAVAVLATRPAGVPTLIVPDVPAGAGRAGPRGRGPAARPDRSPGITGSAGKTTTKDLAAQLVERLGPTVSPYGSFNNEIGHPLTVLRRHRRTPGTWCWSCPRAAPGHIARLCEIAPPSFGVVLCVGRAHAGEFGGLGGGGAGQGRAARRPARRRRGPAQRRRPAGAGHGRAHRGQGGDVRPRATGGGARGGRPARRPGPAGIHAGHARPARRRCGCGCSASTT